MIELWRWDMQPGEAFTSPGHPATTFELLHVEAGADADAWRDLPHGGGRGIGGGPHRNRARLPQ